MTSDVFNLIQNLIDTFHKNGLPCILKDNSKDLKKEIGPKPVLLLMGSNGIFSGENCIFQSLSFQLSYPVIATDLQDFLDFQEQVDEILHLFLQTQSTVALKCSPSFHVLMDKNIYQSIFIFDLNPLEKLYQDVA